MDADLDDFFAKKDKKKSKVKPKFITADELVKNLEDSTKREVAATKPKKPEVALTAAGGVAVGGDNESITKVSEPAPIEEEWKEFEQEQRKDYSGLKIGHLNINEQRQEQPQPEDAYEEDEDDSEGNASGSDGNVKRSGHGPWKKLIPAEEVTQIPVEIEKPSKVYISPALRYSQQIGGGGISMGSGLRSRRTAPDITNTEFFPTLNAARPEEQRKKKNEPAFEEVRHGGRFQRVQEQAVAPVAATNRFQSLDDEADS